METRRIGGAPGRSLDVSVVGLGCNNFGRRIDEAQSRTVVHAALDAGITFFDTAEAYGSGQSETYLGKALGPRRADVVIATKFGLGSGARRKDVLRCAEASLKRLGTDYIDLYQIHKPHPETPIEETLGAFDELVQAGKVRFVGCSNYSAGQLRAALQTAGDRDLPRFVTAQNRYNLLEREIETMLIPFCARKGVGIIPYVPLAGGALTGKYRRGEKPPPGSRFSGGWGGGLRRLDEEVFSAVDALAPIAARAGYTTGELAITWLAAQPTVVSVIAGATRPEQVAENVRAAAWTLSADDLAEIDAALGVVSR